MRSDHSISVGHVTLIEFNGQLAMLTRSGTIHLARSRSTLRNPANEAGLRQHWITNKIIASQLLTLFKLLEMLLPQLSALIVIGKHPFEVHRVLADEPIDVKAKVKQLPQIRHSDIRTIQPSIDR